MLTFKHKKFGNETDEAMPATFTQANYTDEARVANSDGVALSVDGTNWFRLADITGTNATTDYKTVSVNLNDFGKTNSLTLGSSVRIRFQSMSNGEADATDPKFRGGRGFDDVTVVGATATQAPVAQFGASATTAPVCPGTKVQFTDASLFAPTTYAWTLPRRYAGHQHREEPRGDLQHGRYLRRDADRD
ncbi:MAG: hypothetical protein WKG07_12450 [Hymenobacter sp.]